MDMSTIAPGETEILAFAVVGHPNEGKSSVVSTLTERDDIRISSTPGETERNAVYTVEIDGRPMLRFIDTPGFQVPRKTLRWLERHPVGVGENLMDKAGVFASEFSGRPAFDHDIRIFHAAAETDGLLYIVDATKPIGPDDLAEMEILRLLGKTRMAVLNSKGDDSTYLKEWRGALNRHFNAVRRFNAREAAYTERINLLSALRLTDQHWESDLDKVISALETDRIRRMLQAADIAIELLRDCHTKRMQAALKPGEDRRTLQESMMPGYSDWLRKREEQAHRNLRTEFRHKQLELDMEKNELRSEDLFARETWKVLGLTRRQLTSVSALAGAAGGAAVDLALGETTFGVFMAGGAVLGAVTGLAGSRPLSRVRFRVAGLDRPLGRQIVEIGPPRGVQLAFVLIDRAILYLDTVSRRAHANREKADMADLVSSLPLTRQWPKKNQAAVSRYIGKLAKGRNRFREEESLRAILVDIFSSSQPESPEKS